MLQTASSHRDRNLRQHKSNRYWGRVGPDTIAPGSKAYIPRLGGIRRAFGRSVFSNILGEFGVQGVRIAGFIILARALAPKDFGILRVLIAIGMFATMLNTLGIPEALIQRENLN